MKAKRFPLVAMLVFSLATSAAMASTGNGTITYFWVDGSNASAPDGLYLVSVTTQNPNGTGCSGAFRFVTRSKGVMAGLMAAKLANKSITIAGSGTCSIYPNAEDLLYFTIDN